MWLIKSNNLCMLPFSESSCQYQSDSVSVTAPTHSLSPRVVRVTKCWGSLAVLECRQHSRKTTVLTSIIRVVGLPIFPRIFSHYRPHQTKHSVSQFRVFFFNHNSVQQHTRKGSVRHVSNYTTTNL